TVVAIVKFVQEQNDEMNGNVIVGMALCIVISTLTFYNLFNMDKLTELTIKDKQKTKQYIHSLIKKNKWEVKKENDEILIINANLSNIPERQLSFIFRNNNLFINTITIRDNLKSTLFYNHDKRFTESIINNLTDNDLIQSCNS
ncbi:MAG: hypothetical protein Q8909_18040, partial [Bacteroidota bacterium]|nr:hypothetical protein [Bacteroidota bacterium]